MRYFSFILVACILTGCTSTGFRITDKAEAEYEFIGKLVDGESLNGIPNVRIEFYTWFQPLLAMISRKKIGETITNEDGEFTLETKELEIMVAVDGYTTYNYFGSEPFNPREYTVFGTYSKESVLGHEIHYIEPVAGGDAAR